MYLSFYHFEKKPFPITPDPEYLFLNPSNREALASLTHGVENRKGFIVITGEVGVGKTTILRSYLNEADKEHFKTVYVFNSNVSFKGLLKLIFSDLGLNPGTGDVFEMVNRLHRVLIEEYRQGKNVVLIVDEAQNMPIETLENLRMLSNLETSTDKLIQIVLVGQPEFEQILNQSKLRQLKQRIAVRSTISPFSRKESLKYIRDRLADVSIKEGNSPFSRRALKSVVNNAKGIPRIINILCDNALITGFGYKKKKVSKRIVKEIVADLEGRRRPAYLRFTFASSAIFFLLNIFYFASPLREMPPLIREEPRFLLSSVSREAPFGGKRLSLHNGLIKEPLQPWPEGRDASSQASPTEYNEIELSLPERKTEAAKVPPPVKAISPVERSFPVTRIAKRGDSLYTLTFEVYGFANRGLIYWVRQNNPLITDVSRIRTGQRIIFPELLDGEKRVKHATVRRN